MDVSDSEVSDMLLFQFCGLSTGTAVTVSDIQVSDIEVSDSGCVGRDVWDMLLFLLCNMW